MTDLIKLHNIGDFSIHYGAGEFKPKTTVAFPEDLAKKLRRLYPDTVQDIEAVTAIYNAPAEIAKVVEEKKPAGKKSVGGKPAEKKSEEVSKGA